MKEYQLPNGLKVIIEKRPTATIAIEISVHVGSNNEDKSNYGVTHFIEHLLFEGTTKRPNSMLISNEIEKLGGEINAATSNERTFFYIKIAKKYFNLALDVLSDLIQNPLFDKKSIEKERKIILDEINMVTDDPKFHQWILFQKTLFSKHPAKNPVYGTKEIIRTIKREQIIDYYKKHYVPNNLIITVVGGVNGIINDIKNSFKYFNRKPIQKTSRIIEPKVTKPVIKKEKKNILQSYAILGYKVPTRIHADSYVLDVIKGHLGRGQSGKLFQKIRVENGLAYDVGIMHEPSIDYGIFGVYVGTDKKNVIKCKDLILKEFLNLQDINNQELKEAKGYIEGEYLLTNEDNFRFADTLSFFSLAHNTRASFDYIKNINKVTLEDVKRVAKKYLTKNYTLTVIEQI